MKKVFLKRLEITNFKGIKSRVIDFEPETFIYGQNGSGKTTVVDSFIWLLFGKNSEDRKDFSIKPIVNDDGFVSASPGKIENEVIGVFDIDGSELTIKRIMREKWVKSRGESEEKFTGNETLFFWNDVPCQAGEFQNKVSELIDEKLFKLITSPYAFANLNWTERRTIITKIVGDVQDEDIAATRADFKALMVTLSGKSLEEFKKEISAKKKKLKDELELIPARIDEITRGLPEKPDSAMIQIDLNNIDQAIAKCNDRIKDQSKVSEEFFKAKSERQKRIYELDSIISGLINDERHTIRAMYEDSESKKQKIESEIRNIANELSYNQADLKRTIEKIESTNSLLLTLRGKYSEVNASQITFNPNEFVCPTCKRSFDESDIDQKQQEMTEAFNKNKASELTRINTEGKSIKPELEKIIAKRDELIESINLQEEVLAGKKTELSEIKPIPGHTEIEELAKGRAVSSIAFKNAADEMAKLDEVNNLPFSESNDVSSIEGERKIYERQRDELKAKLQNQAIIDKSNARISELQGEAKSFSQQIADLEKMIFTMEAFEKAKIDLVEEKVNKLFTRLKFKMFTTQINGGIAPACEILCNGVPFSDANTASQINAGIEIINVLCDSYQVNAPIFIDGRESVTEIIPTNSQIINMVVSPEDKTFRII